MIYLLRAKSDGFQEFKKFQRAVERETDRKIKSLRSDGGGEYIKTEFREHLESRGIHQQFTIAYTPHQNGVAERMNRTLKDLMRAMLLHKNISQDLWADAVVTAAYIRNRVTSRGIPSGETPYSLWHGKILTLVICVFSGASAGGTSIKVLADEDSTAEHLKLS